MGRAWHKKEWIIVDRLADIILSNVKGCVVDIGMGLSTVVLSKHAQQLGRKQYSCDISKNVIKRVGAPLHENHIVFYGDSFEFVEKFNETPALVLLDDGHQYDKVIKEMDMFLEMMEPGGVIFLHDTYPPSEKYLSSDGGRCGDVYKVRQELERMDSVWTFTWPYWSQAQRCGLTMAMKKEKERPFYRR